MTVAIHLLHRGGYCRDSGNGLPAVAVQLNDIAWTSIPPSVAVCLLWTDIAMTEEVCLLMSHHPATVHTCGGYATPTLHYTTL